MISSKQRSYLRSLANTIQPIFQIGKGGIEENFLKAVGDALEKREIVKISVLNNCDYSAREASEEVCSELNCEGVQIIGNKFVIYKKSSKDPKIQLP